MTKRKFYRKVYHLEVISESPTIADMTLSEALSDTITGDSSGRQWDDPVKIVNGKKAASILIDQGSDTEFFKLTEDGEDIDDE